MKNEQTSISIKDKVLHVEGKPESHETPGSSKYGAIANLLNVTIGAGIIGIPNVLIKMGAIFGFIFIVAFGAVGTWGANTVIAMKQKTGKRSYSEIVEFLFPYHNIGFWVVNITLWTFMFLCLVVYLATAVVFTYPMVKALNPQFITDGDYSYISVFVVAAVTLPVLCLKDLTSLSFVSTMSTIFIIFLLILTSIALHYNEGFNSIHFNLWPTKMDAIDAIGTCGTLLFSYMNIIGVPDIHASMKDKSKYRFVHAVSNALTGTFEFILAIPLFLFFGEHLKKDHQKAYVNHFDEKLHGKNTLMIIAVASLCVSCVVIAGIPVVHHLLRTKTHLMAKTLGWVGDKEMSNTFHYGHVFIIFLCMGIAIGCSNVILLLNFVGTLCGGILMLTLPALMQMRENGGVLYNLTFGIKEGENTENHTWKNFATTLFANAMFYGGMIFFFDAFVVLGLEISK